MKQLLIAAFFLASVLAPVHGNSSTLSDKPDGVIVDDLIMCATADHYTGANSVLVQVLDSGNNVIASATTRCGGTVTFNYTSSCKNVRYTYYYDSSFTIITDIVVT